MFMTAKVTQIEARIATFVDNLVIMIEMAAEHGYKISRNQQEGQSDKFRKVFGRDGMLIP
jgi:hypothetical protein